MSLSPCLFLNSCFSLFQSCECLSFFNSKPRLFVLFLVFSDGANNGMLGNNSLIRAKPKLLNGENVPPEKETPDQ